MDRLRRIVDHLAGSYYKYDTETVEFVTVRKAAGMQGGSLL